MKIRISTQYEHCLQSLLWLGHCHVINSLAGFLIGNPSQMLVLLTAFSMFISAHKF